MIKTTPWEKRATAHSQKIQLRDRLNGQPHKTAHSDLRKGQSHYCQTPAEKLHPVHQNDPRNRPIEDDKLQRSAPKIQRPIKRGNKRPLHLGNWEISTHGDDEDGKKKGTKFPTITPFLTNF